MNEVQKKIFTLLKEIDISCKANDIDYYLCSDTALCAFQNAELHHDAHSAEVAIATDDVSRFLKIMNEKENRIVECWENNENYPDFSLRYVDKTSLCYNLNEYKGNKYNGIFVHITLVRRRSAIRKKNFIIENGINFNSGQPLQKRSLKRFFVALIFKISMIVYGKKRFVRNYFEKQISPNRKNTNYFKIGKKVYPKLILDGIKREIDLYDQKFQTFPHVEQYFLYNYGYNWENKELNINAEKLILSPNISCIDYQEALEKKGWKNKRYAKHKMWMGLLYSPKINAHIRKQQLQIQYIVDTLYLKDLYLPQKEKLIILQQKQQFNTLDNKLQEYLDSTAEKGRMMSFDKDISKMVIERIKAKKGSLYVSELEMRRKSIGVNMNK